MGTNKKADVPITRPLLPPLGQFAALVEDLFETRMLSNFSKYTRLRRRQSRPHSRPPCRH